VNEIAVVVLCWLNWVSLNFHQCIEISVGSAAMEEGGSTLNACKMQRE